MNHTIFLDLERWIDPTSGCPSSWSRGLIYKSLQLQKKENKERQSEREKKREERNHVYCELFNGKQYPTLIWGWFCFQFISENTEAQRGQVRYSRSQNQEVAEPRFKDRFLFQVQHSLWFIKPFFCFWSYPPYYKYKPRYYTMCPMDILSFFTVTQQGRFLRLLAWRFTSLLIEMRLIKVTVPKIDLVKDWALNSAAVVMEERKPLSTPGFHSSEVYTSFSYFLHAQNVNFYHL